MAKFHQLKWKIIAGVLFFNEQEALTDFTDFNLQTKLSFQKKMKTNNIFFIKIMDDISTHIITPNNPNTSNLPLIIEILQGLNTYSDFKNIISYFDKKLLPYKRFSEEWLDIQWQRASLLKICLEHSTLKQIIIQNLHETNLFPTLTMKNLSYPIISPNTYKEIILKNRIGAGNFGEITESKIRGEKFATKKICIKNFYDLYNAFSEFALSKKLHLENHSQSSPYLLNHTECFAIQTQKPKSLLVILISELKKQSLWQFKHQAPLEILKQLNIVQHELNATTTLNQNTAKSIIKNC